MTPEELIAETIRLYLRYEIEVVEAFNLCPWAERSRREGHTAQRVVLTAEPEPERTLCDVDALAAIEDLEVGFVIFPRCEWPRRKFERFVAQVRDLDQERGAVFAAAAFHPEAEANLETPYRLVPFIRRSPDPTIQLIRRSALDAIRRPGDGGTGFVDPASISDLAAFFRNPPKPPLHERVAGANLETVRKVGVEAIERVLEDIAADRARSREPLSPSA